MESDDKEPQQNDMLRAFRRRIGIRSSQALMLAGSHLRGPLGSRTWKRSARPSPKDGWTSSPDTPWALDPLRGNARQPKAGKMSLARSRKRPNLPSPIIVTRKSPEQGGACG